MRRFVVGDIHGALKALKQVLDRAGFDKDKDMLIGLGDYVDSWPDVYDTVEFLRTLPNFVGVIGNHDAWLLEFLSYGAAHHMWIKQGGEASYKDYVIRNGSPEFEIHRDYLKSLPAYLIIDNKLFVHGGVWLYKDNESIKVNLEDTSNFDRMWDRGLFMEIAERVLFPERQLPFSIEPFDEIYVGHTTTQTFQKDFTPVDNNGVYLLDQGAGWDGKLTLMDIDTKEYWQSDFVPTLYPDVEGRS